MNEQNLTAIEIEPSKPATRSVIWLHGLGADGSDFVPIVPELKLPTSVAVRFIFPHAPIMPITINNGYQMRAWYDIVSLSLGQRVDEANMARSVKLVEKLISREVERGIAVKNIMLAGFSQGAVIALMTGLFHPKRLGGLIALSGYLPLTKEMLVNASAANQKLPIFLAHGLEDNIIPYALGKAAYVMLEAAGYPLDWHSYPMPHAVCGEEIADLSLWIQKIALTQK